MNYHNYMTIFTDRSKNPGGEDVVAGVYIPEFNVEISKIIIDGVSVFTAEIVAVILGLQRIEKSNQIKSLLLSHHHSTSALVSEILMSVLQTVQKKTKKKQAIYIWTVHIYRLYRRQCAKYTYIYSVHIVYYKDTLNYQRHIIHRMGTSTLCTVSIHNVVYT